MKLISKDYIIVNEQFQNKDEVLHFISSLAKKEELLTTDSIYEELKNRELEYSTAIGHGFAIPHAKTNKIKDPAVFIIKLTNKIDWGGDEVDIIIPLLTPESSMMHLPILASVSRKLVHEDFRQSVEQANDVDSLYNLFKGVTIYDEE